jgi:hypothetical protein
MKLLIFTDAGVPHQIWNASPARLRAALAATPHDEIWRVLDGTPFAHVHALRDAHGAPLLPATLAEFDAAAGDGALPLYPSE